MSKVAEFRFHRTSDQIPKAILVLVPPSNSDGRGMIKSPEWIKYATENNLLLCGCYFEDEQPAGIEVYCDMLSGSGDALIEAITTYGHIIGVFLDETPLLLWGFSAGGQFNYEFTCMYPKKVKAFVVNKGGIYYTALASTDTRRVAGLFILGDADSWWRKDIVRGIYSVNKHWGANWELCSEAMGHSEGRSAELGRTFFAKILKG